MWSWMRIADSSADGISRRVSWTFHASGICLRLSLFAISLTPRSTWLPFLALALIESTSLVSNSLERTSPSGQHPPQHSALYLHQDTLPHQTTKHKRHLQANNSPTSFPGPRLRYLSPILTPIISKHHPPRPVPALPVRHPDSDQPLALSPPPLC